MDTKGKNLTVTKTDFSIEKSAQIPISSTISTVSDFFGINRFINLLNETNSHGGSLNFKIIKNSDGWVAQGIEVPGILTGGKEINPKIVTINSSIKSAIFAAFNIDPSLTNRNLLRLKPNKIGNRIEATLN